MILNIYFEPFAPNWSRLFPDIGVKLGLIYMLSLNQIKGGNAKNVFKYDTMIHIIHVYFEEIDFFRMKKESFFISLLKCRHNVTVSLSYQINVEFWVSFEEDLIQYWWKQKVWDLIERERVGWVGRGVASRRTCDANYKKIKLETFNKLGTLHFEL